MGEAYFSKRQLKAITNRIKTRDAEVKRQSHYVKQQISTEVRFSHFFKLKKCFTVHALVNKRG